MKARPWLLLPVLAVLLLLSACHSSVPPLAGPAPAVVDVVPPVRPSVERSGAALRQKIRQQLAADNFSTALALIGTSGLPETELAEEFGLALKGALKQAAAFMQKDLPEKAGPLYRAALGGYPKTAAVAARAGTTAADIEAGIDSCADRLMERGLVAYRSGDLEQAIRTWKQVHRFAPQHQPSRKALQTAEVQLANLKKVRAEQ